MFTNTNHTLLSPQQWSLVTCGLFDDLCPYLLDPFKKVAIAFVIAVSPMKSGVFLRRQNSSYSRLQKQGWSMAKPI